MPKNIYKPHPSYAEAPGGFSPIDQDALLNYELDKAIYIAKRVDEEIKNPDLKALAFRAALRMMFPHSDNFTDL